MDFLEGNVVEVRSPKFEFYQCGKPTGHYMRGIIKKVNKNTCMINSLFNGKDYEIKKDILITIQ